MILTLSQNTSFRNHHPDRLSYSNCTQTSNHLGLVIMCYLRILMSAGVRHRAGYSEATLQRQPDLSKSSHHNEPTLGTYPRWEILAQRMTSGHQPKTKYTSHHHQTDCQDPSKGRFKRTHAVSVSFGKQFYESSHEVGTLRSENIVQTVIALHFSEKPQTI